MKEPHPLDFAYIDGMHTFDYVLLDFFFIDKMMSPGGVVAFNDCGWRAIHRALGFVRTHRRYFELDVCLPRDFRSGSRLGSTLRWGDGRSSNDRYFEKGENWEPSFDFYGAF